MSYCINFSWQYDISFSYSTKLYSSFDDAKVLINFILTYFIELVGYSLFSFSLRCKSQSACFFGDLKRAT